MNYQLSDREVRVIAEHMDNIKKIEGMIQGICVGIISARELEGEFTLMQNDKKQWILQKKEEN